MRKVTMVRYSAKPECVDENEALARNVFAELRASAPGHVAYLMFKDGTDYLHLFVNLGADDSSPLTALPGFKAYAKGIGERCIALPTATNFSLQLVEAYGIRAPAAL